MKKITILVDDDVEMIDIFSVRDEKIIPNIREEGYINQKALEVNVYKGENKPAFIEATYFAIPIDDKVENPNQKAIECLKEVKEDLLDISNGYWKCFAKYGQQYMTSDDLEECLKEYIDNKIKELEGESD